MRVVVVHDKAGNIQTVAMVGDSVRGQIGFKSENQSVSHLEVPEFDGLDLKGTEFQKMQQKLRMNYRIDAGALKPTIVRQTEADLQVAAPKKRKR